MPVYNKRGILLLPKVIVLNPKDGLGIRSNLWCVMALLAGLVFMGAVLFVPQLQKVFLAADLSRDQLLVVGVGALAPTVVIQAYKVICELTLIF